MTLLGDHFIMEQQFQKSTDTLEFDSPNNIYEIIVHKTIMDFKTALLTFQNDINSSKINPKQEEVVSDSDDDD